MVLPAAALLLICISAVSAFSIDSYVRDPPGSLAPDTPVTVSYNVSFEPGSTFPPGDYLVMTTDLTNPAWTSELIIEGVKNPRKPTVGQKLTVSGFELSYPNVDENLHVTLTGNAPVGNASAGSVILDVSEITSTGTVLASTHVTKTALVNTIPPATPARVSLTTPVPAETTIPAKEKTDQQNGVLDQILSRLKALFGMQS